MVYSEGFSPRPRIAFGLALPTGSESDGEYIDIQLNDRRQRAFALEELPVVLSESLPRGLDVTGIAVIDSLAPSLQQAVTSCEWDITVKQTAEQLHNWTRKVLDAPSLVVTRERKGKSVTDVLRPLIHDLNVAHEVVGGHTILRAELGTQPRSLRPSELLKVLEPELEERCLRRRFQWIEQDGARLEPLQVGAAPVPHTGACA